tara:strand:- start:245 stop:364 length:120 start_codon:yes stop_codon:yes gene_type:complete
MTNNYSDPFGFKKAINVKSLDKLNQKQINQLARILKNVK